jgi:hypothetical protein
MGWQGHGVHPPVHHDFRHEVDEALDTFVRALDTSLRAVPLRLPMERGASFIKRDLTS